MERGFGPGFDPRRLHHTPNTLRGTAAHLTDRHRDVIVRAVSAVDDREAAIGQ